MKTAHLYIEGMTCTNCQKRIERELASEPGIEKIEVSYEKGTAVLLFDDGIVSLDKACALIEKIGYPARQGRFSPSSNSKHTAIALAVIIAAFVIVQQFGILNFLVPGQLADTTMGYGMLFVIGLLTSVHCLAMCGGINLSQSMPAKAAGKSKRFSGLVPAGLYHGGRVLSYTVIGFVLGALGMLFGGGAEGGIPLFFQGMLKLVAGAFMVVMGLNMLGLFPALRKLQPRLPNAFANLASKASGKTPFIVGLLNGFMPCGPLQSMQLVALVSGSPVAGAFAMLLFGLGTVPVAGGFGFAVSLLGRRFKQVVSGVGALLVVVLGLAMLSQGGTLSELFSPEALLAVVSILAVIAVLWRFTFKSAVYKKALVGTCAVAAVLALALWLQPGMQQDALGSGEGGTAVVDGKQEVKSTLLPSSYPSITVKANTPVTWIIDAPQGSINGCNGRMLIQEYGLEHSFKPGKNVIEFTPTRAGKVTYSCWMGMIHGTIIVTEA